jgi:vitamin B12 transporter
MQKRIDYILFISMLVLCTAFSYSQQIDTFQQLDSVLIISQPLDRSNSNNSISSFRLNSSTIHLLQNDLGNALQHLFPVQINSYGLGNISSISVRGANDDQTNIYWNGLKINSLTLGGTDISLLPALLDGNDRISLDKNNHAIGGALSLQNKVDWNNIIKLKLRSDVNSFDAYYNALTVQFGNKKIQWNSSSFYRNAQLNFLYKDVYKFGSPIDTMRHNQLKAAATINSFYVKLKKNQTLSFHNWYQQKNKEVPSIMGSNEISGKFQRDQSVKSILNYENKFNKKQIQISIAHLYDFLHYSDKRLPTDTVLFINSEYKTHRVFNSLNFIDSLKHQLLLEVGLTYNIDIANVKEYTKKMIELVGDVHGKLSWQNSHFYTSFQLTQPFTSYKYLRPQFALNATYFTKNKRYALSLIYADKYHFADMNDRYWNPGGNPTLQPETAWSLSLENNFKIFSYKSIAFHELFAAINVYYTKIKNNIIWTPMNSVIWSPKNIKTTQLYGSEIQVKYAVQQAEKFNFFINTIYSFNRAEIVKDINNSGLKGNFLRYKPQHTFKSNFYVEQKYIGLGADYMFASLKYTDEENFDFFALKPYHLLDAYITFKGAIKKHELQFMFKVNNITNTSYESIRSYAQPLRNYSITFIYNFSKSQNNSQ